LILQRSEGQIQKRVRFEGGYVLKKNLSQTPQVNAYAFVWRLILEK